LTFPGWLQCKGIQVFLYSPVEILPILQNEASRLVVVWNRRGMSSQLNFEKVRRELEEMSHLQIRRSYLLLAPKWLDCGEGGALAEVLKQSDQSEKTWFWCHYGPTSPGTGSVHRQLLPSLLLWQQSQSMEEAGGKCPCFVWKISELSMVWRKRRKRGNRTWLTWAPPAWGYSKHTASPSYHAPRFELSTGHRATWIWNSPSRTGLSSSHYGASAVMNSGSHPEHTMSQSDNNRQARKEWGYMES
jgi:hypothetical protein